VPDEWEAGDPELVDALVAALSGRVPEEWLPI
jgi:hypothetical protein